MVFLAAILHDVGHVVHRENHSHHSVVVASPVLNRLLRRVYKDTKTQTIVYGEVMHAILCHHKDIKPLTLEAGIIRLADTLDMEGGRSRIAFKDGKVDIHSVSAQSIEKVEIQSSRAYPIQIKITMKNSAGIFQVDNLLARKLKDSGLENYVHVTAVIEGETEKKIIDKFEF